MPKLPPQSEIRKHYFEDRYVIIAPKRAVRPGAVLRTEQHVRERHDEKTCPFCLTAQQDEPAIFTIGDHDESPWLIKVIANRYPALSPDNPKAYGKQEIIIETPNHNTHLNELPLLHVTKVLDVYAERIRELSRDPKIRYVAVFKNEGGHAGATVAHAHSQIIALPFIPPAIQNSSNAIDHYYLEKGRCPYCDIIAKEQKQKVRVVYNDGAVMALSPYSTSAPYGVWIMPIAHKRRLLDLNNEEKEGFAKALQLVLGKLESIGLSYNYFVHQSLEVENHHLRLKIASRLNVWGGLELGSGVVINPIVPEEAALFYRTKTKSRHVRS